ncbi:MAG TPA: phosphatidylcholine synthase [Hyphomicrobiaceae bacterium]
MAWSAALVHLFTALGAVCALLATRAALSGDWEQVFGWLGVALVIDGVDGTLARLADVKRRLPRFSGDRLDLVIDYVAYVFVPALALLQAGFLGGRGWGVVLGSIILVSSLFHFSDTQSKTEDHSFVGFPAIWNIVAFYAFAFGTSTGATALLVVTCAAFTFVPLHWAHPLRTPLLWPITFAVTAVWLLAAVGTIWSGFPADNVSKGIFVLAALYGVGLALFSRRARGRATIQGPPAGRPD